MSARLMTVTGRSIAFRPTCIISTGWRYGTILKKRKATNVPPAYNGTIPNPYGKGAVGFCDGHADFVGRAFAHSNKHTTKEWSVLPAA